MGFRAKCWMGDGVKCSGWMDGYPLDCNDNKITCGANKARATSQDLHNLYVIVYM